MAPCRLGTYWWPSLWRRGLHVGQPASQARTELASAAVCLASEIQQLYECRAHRPDRYGSIIHCTDASISGGRPVAGWNRETWAVTSTGIPTPVALLITSWPWPPTFWPHFLSTTSGCHGLYTSTEFGVESSSRFSFKARTHTHTFKVTNATDHPIPTKWRMSVYLSTSVCFITHNISPTAENSFISAILSRHCFITASP